MFPSRLFSIGFLLFAAGPLAIPAAEYRATRSPEIYQAAKQLKPGDTLRIAPGEYRGVYLSNLQGEKEKPITLTAEDPQRPPLFNDGTAGLHLSGCEHLVVRNLKIAGRPGNGVNVDDGKGPARHIVLDSLVVLDTGPTGNRDALKMSGVDHFVVRNCRFEGWGGSGIDMVGCHHGVVEDCLFRGKEGFGQHTGVQMKGGSADILVQTSFFDHPGQRAINIGGGTGLSYFRPKDAMFEASRITVAGNRFAGSMAPVAWASADGGRFHHNTIYLPEKWVLRILQEQQADRFVKCRNGKFDHNLIVYDRQVRVIANVGGGTQPGTFVFSHNAWFRTDGPTRVRLPVDEKEGISGIDPQLVSPGKADMQKGSSDPKLKDVGAGSYRRPPAD